MNFFNHRFAKFGIAVAWVAAIGGAQSYNVGDLTPGGIYVAQGSNLDTASAAVQNSTLVTERRTATVASETQANMVLSQIADRLERGPLSAVNSASLFPQTGANAGSGCYSGSVWGRAGYDNLKENNITNFGGWRANLWTFALGYDYRFSERILAGAALVYSNLNGRTAFNQGNIRDNAYGIVPYIAFKVHPCIDLDLIAGYSRVIKNRSRLTPASQTPSLSGPQATSSPKSDRFFAALYANGKHRVDCWQLLARLGYIYITDRQKGFREANGLVNPAASQNQDLPYASSSTNVSRVSLRLQAGYAINRAVEPYAFLAYARDFGATKVRVQNYVTSQGTGITMPAPNRQRGNNTYGGGLGLNANVGCDWTTGFEASYAKSDRRFRVYSSTVRIVKKF